MTPPEHCEHCQERLTVAHGTESGDCAYRPVPCDSCGKVWERQEMFWQDDLLIGDCCDREREGATA